MSKQIFLRIAPGILTRKIQVPDSLGHTYRVMLADNMSLATMNKMQAYPTAMKTLTFSYEGEKHQGIPVFNLQTNFL